MRNAMKRKDTQDMEDLGDFLSGDGAEAMSAMMGIMYAQQNIALSLTKLIVEHDKRKDEVFSAYREACALVKEQLEN